MTRPLERGGVSLTLATWNVHYGIGRDNRFDMERILAVIEEIDADIIGLQEVGWHRPNHERLDHFAFLRERSGYHVAECLVRDPLRTRFGNALLSRFPLRDSRWIDLKVPGHSPRAAVLADLELSETALGGLKSGPGGIRVLVTHLGLIPWERIMQANRLVAAVDAGLPTGWPSVLLGDFNIWRAQAQSARTLEARFPKTVALPSYPSIRPMVPLDRIYLSAGLRLRSASVLEQGLASLASDHLPVVAQVELVPAPESSGGQQIELPESAR